MRLGVAATTLRDDDLQALFRNVGRVFFRERKSRVMP
jgi:hypothetical protein